MAEYIERDCFKCFHYPVCEGNTDRHNYFGECKHFKPASDVVEVVRCKDCEYKNEWIKNGIGEYFCRKSGLWSLSDYSYCHCGEKRRTKTNETD